MKKYITILILPLLMSCSDDDSGKGEVKIIDKGLWTSSSINENGKYDNVTSAEVKNTTNKTVRGKVKFEIKDVGYIYSDVKEVTNQAGYSVTIGKDFETDMPIQKDYLLSAEFIQE